MCSQRTAPDAGLWVRHAPAGPGHPRGPDAGDGPDARRDVPEANHQVDGSEYLPRTAPVGGAIEESVGGGDPPATVDITPPPYMRKGRCPRR